MENFKFTGCWYCEYKNHVKIHDYFNIMVNNFPLLTFRRLDFGLHDDVLTRVYSFGVFGFTHSWIK